MGEAAGGGAGGAKSEAERATTPPGDVADWRRADLNGVELPYALMAIQQGLISLDKGLARVGDRFSAWDRTFDTRAKLIASQAAESAANAVKDEIVGQLLAIYGRVAVVEKEVGIAGARASAAEIKADAAIVTGKHAAITIVNDMPTPPPQAMGKSDGASDIPLPIRILWKRHTKWAVAIAGVASFVYALVQAWAAIRGH